VLHNKGYHIMLSIIVTAWLSTLAAGMFSMAAND
jgi:hypothetical protein